MDRAEKIGLGIAVAGHAVLFGLLSVGFLATPNPVKLQQQPVEVSLVEDVGLEASAPQAVTPPAQSIAPDIGTPEDAARPAAAEPVAEPEPTPPQPQPQPEPQPRPEPEPQPKPVAKPQPAPAKSAPAKPAPKPVPVPTPAPVPAKPRPKPAAAAPAKPTPKPAPAAPAKPAPKPATAAPTRTAAKPSPATSTAAAAPAKAKPAAKGTGTGTSQAATAARPRGSRLGSDFLKGLSSESSPGTSEAPRAAKIDARAMAGIVQAIARQIQPCADRQVNPGPGANQIVTTLNLRLNPDGSLAAAPRMVRQTGVDDENERYKQRVFDLGVAAFKGCAPLRLPAEYYDTPSGGWNNINFQWKLQ